MKELWESEHIARNPISLVKKSCKYMVKGNIYKPPHTLDDETWQLFVDTLTLAADENPAYEMHRFLVLTLKVLFLGQFAWMQIEFIFAGSEYKRPAKFA